MSDEDTTQETDEQQQSEQEATTEQESQEGSLEEVDTKEASEWDPDRALAKIRKLNNEIRSAKKRADETDAKATQAEQTAAEMRGQLDRQRVARRLGLPDTDDTDQFLSRLQGGDVDELMEDAEKLLSLVAASAKKPGTRRPTETLRGGLDPDAEPEETDLRKLGSRMFQR